MIDEVDVNPTLEVELLVCVLRKFNRTLPLRTPCQVGVESTIAIHDSGAVMCTIYMAPIARQKGVTNTVLFKVAEHMLEPIGLGCHKQREKSHGAVIMWAEAGGF